MSLCSLYRAITGPVSSYAPISPLSVGRSLDSLYQSLDQEPGTTPRTKFTQADAPSAVLDTSPREGRIKVITSVGN